MPDLWMDVDAALGAVRINTMQLIDDTDFKAREESMVFNQSGLDLVWNFTTTAGAFTQTAVTPTDTAGDYDFIAQGNGFYTIPMARQTGETGRVYAVDIQQEMLDLLQDAAREAELSNITGLLGTAVDPRLPEGSIDLMIVVDVYHEMSHPVQMLAAIRTSLKPQGRLVLVEFRMEDPEVRIKKLHKMSKEQVLKELAANGFKLKGEFDGLPQQHMMTFVIDPEWKSDSQPESEPAAVQASP